MDSARLHAFIEHAWDHDILPALRDYIAIPCESPAFDPDWAQHGHMDRAVELMTQWARQHLADVPGAQVETIRLPGRTPTIFIDIPGASPAPVLLYGHLDKQPEMSGWLAGRGAWTPTLEGDRLYGRGGADDGYALFSAITAVQALRAQALPHPRCAILIEASEESGSPDLAAYIEHLAPRLGEPVVILALDASAGNYEQLWMTTSLRGQVAGTLRVQVLREGVHSGEASGVVPSSFRIARQLLSRVEDPISGEVMPAEFHSPIPTERREQATQAVAQLGPAFLDKFPFQADTRAVQDDLAELALNQTWRPQLTVTGLDGLPDVAHAAAVMQPYTALKLSLRLPPIVDPVAVAPRLKALLEARAPYGCEVSFTVELVSPGWNAPSTAPWLQNALDAASHDAFGQPSALIGGGGGIPFLAMLAERFPKTQFVVTGVLGPHSNAHGPNEFLHLPTAMRVTAAVAQVLHATHHHASSLRTASNELACAIDP